MQINASRQALSPDVKEPARKHFLPKGIIHFALFLICSVVVTGVDTPPRPLGEQAPLSEFSAGRALKHLAVISRAPHPINSAEHAVVRDYIVSTLQGLGLNPQVQRTTDVNERFEIEGALENIVGRLKGSSQEKAVLLVCHYDSVPAGPGASDDGAAVASFLEAARALKSFPQMKRDIIFLFTDGEERGLLGARAFVEEHPWAHDAGVVLNFEARGISGPSIMFETSDENGWLIRNFGQAASHPVANSLSYEIYKRLPNNTDFTIFRHAGYSGLNFAFIDGLDSYHTDRDSIQKINPGSLQHHGDYVLELTKQFGNAATEDPKPANVVYFDVMGWFLVSYSQATAIFFLVLTGILLGSAFVIGLRKGNLRIGAFVIGFICMTAGLAIAVTCAEATLRIVSSVQSPRIEIGLMHHSGWYVLAFTATGLACAAAFFSLISKWIGSANLMAGVLLGWLVATIAISVYFPGGAYLFLWPLLFSLLGWLAIVGKPKESANQGSTLWALSVIPALVLIVPMAHKIFFAFAAQSTLIVSAFAGLLLSLMIGQIGPEAMSKRWILPCMLAAGALGLFTIAFAVSGSM
jgi:hypothetical protein